MAYQSQVPFTEHDVHKAQKVVSGLIGVLQRDVVLPETFNKRSIDLFKGALGDTVTQQFEGNLPWREYEFRNDRTDPIIFDVMTKATATLSLGSRLYSATRLTDEQRDFDDLAIADLIPTLASAVVTGLEYKAGQALQTQAYEYTIGGAEADLRGALTEARKVLNKLRVPKGGRILAVGSDFAAALLEDEKITSANVAGNSNAETALNDATLGNLRGFRVVESDEIPDGEAIAYYGDSFSLFLGAPSIPLGAIRGATLSYGGYALRFVQDYETTRMADRAFVDSYYGIAPIKERLAIYDAATRMYDMTTDEYFVRAIKLTLDGTSVYPTAADEVGKWTGLTTAWTPPTP